VGQGALGIECRLDDERVKSLLAALHHEPTSRCVAAERGVMVALEGDCKTPLGAFGERRVTAAGAPELHLRAFVCEPDGRNLRRGEEAVPWPASDEEAREVGLSLGARLRGASLRC
jgi:hydroxymethylbilane synthase